MISSLPCRFLLPLTCCRQILLAIFTLAVVPWTSAQEDFQIVDSRLNTAESVEISASVPDTEVTYRLEFSANPETEQWQPVYDSLIARGAQPDQLKFSTQPASTTSGYYRVVQIPGKWVPVVINEVMPNNTSTLADEDGEFTDWIELHNLGAEESDLTGFSLSDNPEELQKWTFAGIRIPAGGHLIVFLSGKDRPGSDGVAPHANFKMSNGRESLWFSNPAGQPLDRIAPGPLASNDSLGRNVENPLTWHEFDGTPKATPAAANIPTSGSLPAPYVVPPGFSKTPGFYTEPVQVSLKSSHPGDAVFYTLDGSEPDKDTSLGAVGPMQIDATTVVRAITVSHDGTASEPATSTYFVNVPHSLPVLSITADPEQFEFRNGRLYGFGNNLFSRTGRIIGNFPWSNSNAWQNREIDANIEMYESDKSQAFNDVLGLKIFGGWGSRGYAQKSFAVFARARRGTGRIQHQLFPDKEVSSFESFVLRNSGNDNQSTHLTVPRSEIREFSTPASYGSYFVNGNFTLFRDAMLTSLSRDIGLDTQGYRPSVVYINGDYWGIYNIREKLSEHYVESNHGVPEDQVDLIEGYGSANAGSSTEYNKMRNFISRGRLDDPEKYQTVKDSYLHIDNFIDYHLSVIFFQNFDIGNIKCWRPRVEGGRFRWLVYDQDYGFNLWKPDVYLPAMKRDFSDYENMFDFYTNASGSGTGWPNSGGRTILLRNLLENDEFKSRFIIRCADLLNSTFSSEYVISRINSLVEPIRSEIPAHLSRWSWAGVQERGFDHPYKEEDAPLTAELWESHVQVMRDYAAARPAKLRSDLISHFGLENGMGEVRVGVEPADAGAVLVHSIPVSGTAAAPWSGTYFEDFPPPLTALAKPGWTLSNWSGDVTELDGSYFANVTVLAASTVTAQFEPASLSPANAAVAITEIQYHPADKQAGSEWIEIWNSGAEELDLSDWRLFDEQDDHSFSVPGGTVLAADARLILASDPQAFAAAYPDITDVIGGFAFKFGNGGDAVRLVDSAGAIVEAVAYGDKAPWPEAADGGGFTLSRVLPITDPGSPTSWQSSATVGGSPGN
ncbi:MAG: hypothetical protein ACI9R3_005816 [Verrucomicrobiales bacterium]|jgi:hypothetical protein